MGHCALNSDNSIRYHFPDIAPTYSRKKEKLLNFNLVKGRHNLLPTLCSNELCFLRRNFLQKNILFSHFYAKMPGSINHQQDIPKCFACSFPCSASSYYCFLFFSCNLSFYNYYFFLKSWAYYLYAYILSLFSYFYLFNRSYLYLFYSYYLYL